MQNLKDSDPNNLKISQEEGRGTLILVFGILSLFLIGPILGIPAWIMGHKDIKKINRGSISKSAKTPTKIGMTLGIVGTFIGLLAWIVFISGVLVGISTFNDAAKEANRDGLMADAANLAAFSQVYYSKDKEEKGGGNSFIGFEIPRPLSESSNGTFSLDTPTDSSISIIGVGKELGNDNEKTVSIKILVKPESIKKTIIN